MQRRKFLKNTSAAGFTLSSLFAATTSTHAENKIEHTPPDNFELNEVTIDLLQQYMESGKYSSRTITEMYLKRTAAVDKSGPKLNAVIELNPEALSIADA